MEEKTLVDLVKERIGERQECAASSDIANSRLLAIDLELSLVYEALAPLVGKPPVAPKIKRRPLSEEAKRKMSESQKRRWAERRDNSGPSTADPVSHELQLQS